MSHVCIAALRLYNQMDFFKPHFVDVETNYRYCGIEQNSRLDLTAYIKELDLPQKYSKRRFPIRGCSSLLMPGTRSKPSAISST